MIRSAIILGVDLSLTSTGLVVVPSEWDYCWRRVYAVSVGLALGKQASVADQIHRRRAIADDICRVMVHRDVTHVWIEGYPAGGGKVFALDKLAELGGVVRDNIMARTGIAAQTAPQSTARKLLLGRLPSHHRKEHVVEALRVAGAGFADADQADAFVAANYGLSELGAPCLAACLWRPQDGAVIADPRAVDVLSGVDTGCTSSRRRRSSPAAVRGSTTAA